jgi:hypothetical protein
MMVNYHSKLLRYFLTLAPGNCNICADRKIFSMNDIKWYEIWLRQKGWVQKIFQTLTPDFGKGINQNCLKFGKAWKQCYKEAFVTE